MLCISGLRCSSCSCEVHTARQKGMILMYCLKLVKHIIVLFGMYKLEGTEKCILKTSQKAGNCVVDVLNHSFCLLFNVFEPKIRGITSNFLTPKRL